MKKFLLTALVLLGLAVGANAQQNAIGVRLGWGFEASYQRDLGSGNRLEVDLGLPLGYAGFNLAGIYQWVKPLPQLANGFNWYYGVGANIGAWANTFNIGVNGQIGLEYRFTIPLVVSLDWRPSLGIYTGQNHTAFHSGGLWGFALGARYIF